MSFMLSVSSEKDLIALEELLPISKKIPILLRKLTPMKATIMQLKLQLRNSKKN